MSSLATDFAVYTEIFKAISTGSVSESKSIEHELTSATLFWSLQFETSLEAHIVTGATSRLQQLLARYTRATCTQTRGDSDVILSAIVIPPAMLEVYNVAAV